MTYDFIVLGAGLAGLTTARELAREGFKVALIDKGAIGKEASWAAGGILSSMRPWAEHPASAVLSNEGKRVYPSFIENLVAETGLDAEYVKSGLLMAGKDDIENTIQWAESNRINWSQGADTIPEQLHIHSSSIYLPDIAQVRPTKLIKALKQALVAKHVALFEHAPVERIEIVKGRFQSVTFNSTRVVANALIVSAGAWSAELLKRIGQSLDVKPICGQMLCVKVEKTKPAFKQVVLDGGHYLIPRRDGHVLVGSNMEDTGFAKHTTDTMKAELMQWAKSAWPAIEQAKLVAHWAGLRPANESGRPYIGEVSGTDGLYLNTGHFRKGVLQAPVSARLLVDHLMERSSFTDINRYNIGDQG